MSRNTEPKNPDIKRKHGWAAVGYDFKSKMILYEVPSNSNGKMSQRVYINSILKPEVKIWIQRGNRFVLEKNNDSGHGPGKSNIVINLKKDYGLEYLMNAPQSPDLSPIKNCWQPAKAHYKKFPHWDDQAVKADIYKGWKRVDKN